MNDISKKTTCIMFTDIVGYTRLMEENEMATFQTLLHLRNMMEEIHDQFSGQLLQFIGDGSLSTFDRAEDAVEAALMLRRKVSALLDISLRIGIHHGTVMQHAGNTCGLAINIAARIEDSAGADCIFLSRNVIDQLSDPAQFELVSQGHFHLKNVRKSIELFALEEDAVLVPGDTAVKNSQVSTQFLQRWSSYFSGIALALAFLLTNPGGANSGINDQNWFENRPGDCRYSVGHDQSKAWAVPAKPVKSACKFCES